MKNLWVLIVVLFVAMAASVQAGEEDEQMVKLADCPKAGQIVLVVTGHHHEVEIQADGTILCKPVEGHEEVGQDGEEKDEDGDEQELEESVQMSDLPKAVRKTLKREARKGDIEEIEKEREDGKVVYEAEVLLDGKEYEVKIAEDGTLLSKMLEEEEQEEEDEEHEERESDEKH